MRIQDTKYFSIIIFKDLYYENFNSLNDCLIAAIIVVIIGLIAPIITATIGKIGKMKVAKIDYFGGMNNEKI